MNMSKYVHITNGTKIVPYGGFSKVEKSGGSSVKAL